MKTSGIAGTGRRVLKMEVAGRKKGEEGIEDGIEED